MLEKKIISVTYSRNRRRETCGPPFVKKEGTLVHKKKKKGREKKKTKKSWIANDNATFPRFLVPCF